MKEAILSGALRPNERLILPKLSERFGIGLTPLREALSRLSSSGLVIGIGNKGFRVAELSPERLVDFVRASIAVEITALRLSMAQRTPAWEDEVVLALHHLRKAIRAATASQDWMLFPEFEVAHREFHKSLVSGCGSGQILGIRERLFEHTMRYRRLLSNLSRPDPSDFLRNHEELADTIINADIEAGANALFEHMSVLVDMIDPNEGTTLLAVIKRAGI